MLPMLYSALCLADNILFTCLIPPNDIKIFRREKVNFYQACAIAEASDYLQDLLSQTLNFHI